MIKTVAYSLRTDRHTHTETDKSLKTEGPMILSIDIFYFKTVIIGGPITYLSRMIMSSVHRNISFRVRNPDGITILLCHESTLCGKKKDCSFPRIE